MDFFSFAFFIKICDTDIDSALKEFSLTHLDARNLLDYLGRFLGQDLFYDLDYPSFDTLTPGGKTFLLLSRKFVNDLLKGFLDNINTNDDKSTISIRSDVLSSKDFLLPIIDDIENQKKYRNFKLMLASYDHPDNNFNTAFHVIFDKLTGTNNLLFEKRWSVKITQGLYATAKYLYDVGNIPIYDQDLLNHSILGIGDSFNEELYSEMNWHLSKQYMGFQLTPSILINSQSVIKAAIKSNLGIGSIMHYQRMTDTSLIRVLPNLDGPSIDINFAVRKNLPDIYRECVSELETKLIFDLEKFGLEIIYGSNV